MFRVAALPVLAFCMATALPAADPGALPAKQIYRQAVLGTVVVFAEKGDGTGWVLDAKRKLLITNAHVVGKDAVVQIILPRFKDGKLVAERAGYKDAKPIPARVLAIDRKRDLALLEAKTLPDWVRELKPARTEPEPGERIHSLGNPVGTGALWVYTLGTVRQVYHRDWKASTDEDEKLELSMRVIESQGPINHGDSGGPMFNDRGELVAVTQGFSKSGNQITIGISAAELRAFLRKEATRPTGREAELATKTDR